MNNTLYKKNEYTIEKYSLITHTYDTGKPGKKILVLGAIHGDEICGTEAIKLVLADINLISFTSGSVTFIPISNPAAFKINKRFLNKDLGRSFTLENLGNSYEDQIIKLISKHVNDCDYLLDIHSTYAKSHPCVFQDWKTKQHSDYSQSLGIHDIITGWPDIYSDNNSPDVSMYAYHQGKTGVLIECGSHQDITAKHIGYTAIIQALEYLNIGTIKNIYKKSQGKNRVINMHKLYIKNKNGTFYKIFEHLEKMKQGDCIIKYSDGEIITAIQDCYILFPKDNALIGEEWYYIGYGK